MGFVRSFPMEQWIPFSEGEYIIEEAFLTAPDNAALNLEKGVLEVYKGAAGQRHIKGHARVRPYDMVQLMEENDTVDLILDLGSAFKYRMPRPLLRSGKVFAPDVKAVLQFSPTVPWESLSEDAYAEMRARMAFISP
jgi:hypothetical protein